MYTFILTINPIDDKLLKDINNNSLDLVTTLIYVKNTVGNIVIYYNMYLITIKLYNYVRIY